MSKLTLEPIQGKPGLFRELRTGIIYLRGTFPGCPVDLKRSCRTKDINVASKKAKEFLRTVQKLDPNYNPTTIKEVALDCIEANRLEWKDSTEDGATWLIEKRIIPVFGDLLVEGMTDSRWTKFAAEFYRSRPGEFLFNTRKYMTKVLNHAKALGVIEPHRKFKLPIRDPKSREGLYIPREDFLAMLGACSDVKFCSDDKFAKLKIWLIISYYMGTRPGEAAHLSWDRVNFERGSFTFNEEDTKTGRKREIAIAPEVIEPLKAWRLKCGDSRWVFQGRQDAPVQRVNAVFNRMIARAKLPDYNPNDLRHTFITNKVCIEKKSIIDVALYVDNSAEMIEQRYLHQKFETSKSVVAPKLRAVK